MHELRYDPTRSGRANTCHVEKRGTTYAIDAYIRTTTAALVVASAFVAVIHDRGAVRARGALLISRRDATTWIVEPCQHDRDLPLMTLALVGVPEGTIE